MESEVSLLMANQTLVRADLLQTYNDSHSSIRHLRENSSTILSWGQAACHMSVIPIVFYCLAVANIPILFQPTSHFGALIVGSDIDGRQMRGKGTC